MRAQAARKPISMMSSRIIQIVPDLGVSASMGSFSPGGRFTKAEGDDVSLKSVYDEKSKENENNFTLEDLRRIEMHRRALLLRAEMPVWRILRCWTGTCLSQITADALIWVSLSIYVAIRIYAHCINYVPHSVYSLSEDNNLEILGGFLSFFLVLFVNQTNGRFLQMYGFSKAASGRIQDLTGMAKAQLPPEIADRIVRHINAAHLAGYVGLNAIGHGSPYSKSNFFDQYNNQFKLLNSEEMRMLSHNDMEKSGLYMKELVIWCQLDVAKARKLGYIDRFQEIEMNCRILQFRASLDGIYDFTDQPPHFFYIHFLVLLSAIYLPLFAVDTAIAGGWGDDRYFGLDIMNFIIVFLQCIFVIGLRALGVHMIDPYGEDLEDLSVISYVEGTLEICSLIMNSSQPEYDD